MKWFYHVDRNEIRIEVQVRPVDNLSSGFISARKLVNFEPHGVDPATVQFNIYISEDLSQEKTTRLIEWLQVANRLRDHLDMLVKNPEDFKLRYGVVQYSDRWTDAFLEKVEE